MLRLPVFVLVLLALSACNSAPPTATPAIASPAIAPASANDGDKPPAFDRNGNANYGSQGN